MEGICHESPRWVSLLVAETYYPDTFFPTTSTPLPPPPPVEDFYNFQQYLKRRVEGDEDPSYRVRPVFKEKKPKQHCDGVDHIGCYIVRLYYDWFLVNGSCKCWKPSPKRILTGKWLLIWIATFENRYWIIEQGFTCWFGWASYLSGVIRIILKNHSKDHINFTE